MKERFLRFSCQNFYI